MNTTVHITTDTLGNCCVFVCIVAFERFGENGLRQNIYIRTSTLLTSSRTVVIPTMMLSSTVASITGCSKRIRMSKATTTRFPRATNLKKRDNLSPYWRHPIISTNQLNFFRKLYPFLSSVNIQCSLPQGLAMIH